MEINRSRGDAVRTVHTTPTQNLVSNAESSALTTIDRLPPKAALYMKFPKEEICSEEFDKLDKFHYVQFIKLLRAYI